MKCFCAAGDSVAGPGYLRQAPIVFESNSIRFSYDGVVALGKNINSAPVPAQDGKAP
jgi:hypothetical protein